MNRNLFFKTIFSFLAIFSFYTVQVYAMNSTFNTVKSTFNKIKSVKKDDVDQISVSKIADELNKYIYLNKALLTVVEAFSDGYPNITLSKSDAIKSIKLGNVLENFLNIPKNEIKKAIDISQLEQALNEYFQQCERLILKIRSEAVQELQTQGENSQSSVLNHLIQNLPANIVQEQKQNFIEETFSLITLLITYNLTALPKIIEEIQTMANDKFNLELTGEQITNYIQFQKIQNISQKIYEKYSPDFIDFSKRFAIDFQKSINKKALAQLFGCSETELNNFVKFDVLTLLITNLLLKKEIEQDQLNNIFNLEAIENRFGLAPNTLEYLVKVNSKDNQKLYGAFNLLNLISPKGPAIAKGAVLGFGGLATLWLIGQGLCPNLINTIEPQSILYGLLGIGAVCAGSIAIYNKLPSRISEAQINLTNIYQTYCYAKLAMLMGKKLSQS